MITLFKFEDTYGMYTVFSQLNNISNVALSSSLIAVPGGSFAIRGSSSQAMFTLSIGVITKCKTYGVDRIVFVFDSDNELGNKSDVMSVKWLSDSVRKFKDSISSNGLNVELEFCLTSYSAETILLYQTVNNLSVSVEDIVNFINTNKFQLRLLGSQFGIFNDKKTKNMLETYLDVKKLSRGNSYLNKDVLDWIRSGCDISFRHMDLDSVLKKLDETKRVFEYNKQLVHEFVLSSEINQKSFVTNSQVSPSDLLTSAMTNLR